MEQPIVYLMRGLPSSGKTYTARGLAGPTGVVLETDQYFYQQSGVETRYVYRTELLAEARQWNFDRFVQAVDARVTPIVVDRGNGLNAETQRYACHAVAAGYQVQLQEPESEWWQEIRVLLKYKHVNGPILDQWAVRLAEMNRATHRTPVSTIRSWMESWRHDVSVEEILNYSPETEHNRR